MTDAAIETVLRRDCAIVAAAFIVVTALAGSYALWLATDMGMRPCSHRRSTTGQRSS